MTRAESVQSLMFLGVVGVLAGVVIAQAAPPAGRAAERERAVLAVLRKLDFGGVTAARRVYEWQGRGLGTRCLVRPDRGSTGFAQTSLDAIEAAGIRLAAAYGVDWRVTATGEAVEQRPFVGIDEVTQLAWALPGLQPARDGWFHRIADGDAITEAQFVARASGTRICFVTPLQLLEVDGEAMVAATLVDFLNRTTAGDDVDLSAVFFAGVQRLAWPLPKALATEPDEDGFVRLHLTQPELLQFPVDCHGFELRDAEDPRAGDWQPLPAPSSTSGLPTRVQVPLCAKGAGARAVLRVLQRAGRERIEAIGEGGVALLPGTFEPSRPFTVDLVLGPGTYELDPHLLIGLPAK